MQSHPEWVRGLKHYRKYDHNYLTRVAPRVGAWIETSKVSKDCDRDLVAPRVGAWIETSDSTYSAVGGSSRTPSGCVD